MADPLRPRVPELIRRRAGSRVAAGAAGALAALIFLAPAAWACPVCVGAGFPRRAALAYLGVTGLLSALPLVLAGLVVWLVRRAAAPPESSPQGTGANAGDA